MSESPGRDLLPSGNESVASPFFLPYPPLFLLPHGLLLAFVWLPALLLPAAAVAAAHGDRQENEAPNH